MQPAQTKVTTTKHNLTLLFILVGGGMRPPPFIKISGTVSNLPFFFLIQKIYCHKQFFRQFNSTIFLVGGGIRPPPFTKIYGTVNSKKSTNSFFDPNNLLSQTIFRPKKLFRAKKFF